MRVLMLAQFYAPVIGGEERHVQDLSIELVKRGHEVAVATLYLPRVAEFEVDQGVRVYRIKSTTQRASWLYSEAERSHVPPLPDPELVWTLRRIVAREKPDIVHAHNWLLHSFLPLKRYAAAPLFVSLHDYSLRCVQKRLMNRERLCDGPEFKKCVSCAAHHYGRAKGGATVIAHRLMDMAVHKAVDMFLPVSRATAIGSGLVENLLPFQVIPNFLPDNGGPPSENADAYLSQLPEEDYLLFVGDLSRDKGIDILLNAYARLEHAPPLALIGRKRPDTPVQLPDNVVALGSWPHAAVIEAWSRSTVALVPSVCRETFGIVAIEAMAAGKPVIASRIGGLTDIVVDGETGFLVPPGDVVALEQAIERLVNDSVLRERMGQSARQRAARFRASAVVPRIERLYRSFVQRPTETEWEVLSRMSLQEIERVAVRAQMVLLSARGLKVSDIADIQSASRGTVHKWLDRFDNEGATGLYDRPRKGRRAKMDEEVQETIEEKIDEPPTEHTYNLTVATTLQLTQDLQQMLKQTLSQETTGMSFHHVKQIWRQLKKQVAASLTRSLDGIQEAAEQFFDQQLPLGITGLNLGSYGTSPVPGSRTVVTSHQWGWLPQIALLQSLSLLLVATAYSGARASAGWAEPLFWLAMAALIIPVVIRIVSTQVSRRERIALVVLLGMSFYLVKVMHSPLAFTFPDELSNMRNVREILQNHHLFEENPELPVMGLYPGLPTVTSTLVTLSGSSIFPAGLLVIGAARLVLFLALYLLYEQVSGSALVAGLATLLYMANPNFLFYTAEYSYESLALPLAIVVLYIVARREMTGKHRLALTAVALLGIMTVIITHHMTSYALAALLCAITIFSVVSSRGRRRGPWDLALFALLATSFWLLFIARITVDYLSPVLSGAVRAIFRVTAGEESSRQLFRASSGYVSPLWEQLTGLGSAMFIALGLPFGSFEIWQRHRDNVFAVVLAVVAILYLPMQLLRFTSRGWETANRSSEFLFIGIAFVLALGIVKFWLSRWAGWISNLALAGIVIILFFGGFIAGWPPQARLPRPYVVAVGSDLVEPEGVAMAKWAFDFLGPDNRVATDKVNAKLLNGYGEQAPFTGGAHGIKDMFFSNNVGPSERNIIRQAGIQYIVFERRLISWDHMIGLYFFNQENSPSWELELITPEIYEKFEGVEDVHRILDSGNIVIYDVGVYHETPMEME